MNEESNNIPDWENSKIFSVGKEPAHSTLIPFESVDEALGKWEDSPYFKSLNGNWKFNWAKNPSERPKDFYYTGNTPEDKTFRDNPLMVSTARTIQEVEEMRANWERSTIGEDATCSPGPWIQISH